MSDWGKLLVMDIVIPSGGWTWSWFEGATPRTVTVPAATYDDVHAVGRALRDALRAMGGGHTTDVVAISQVGICTITISGMTDDRWAGCDDELEDLLGFDQSESVNSGSITGALQVTHAWYPGAITHDHHVYRGAGLVSGSFWIPVDSVVKQWSGSGEPAIVHPGQLPLRRALRWDIVSTAEVRDLKRGVAQLWETHRAKRLRWYPDRELGTVDDYGSKGDPRSDVDGDAAADYWEVSIVDAPDPREVGGSRSWWSIEMVVQAGAYP